MSTFTTRVNPTTPTRYKCKRRKENKRKEKNKQTTIAIENV